MTNLSMFDLIAILPILAALFGWINHAYVTPPQTIGLVVMGLATSFVLISLELIFPQMALYDEVVVLVRQIDFQQTVLDGMLALRLFSGAMHVDFAALKSRL